MPLYKLTERRMKKRAREDEDGITRIKEAMREMGEEVDSASGSGSEGWSESDSDDEDDEDDGEDEDGSEDEEDGDLEVDMEGLGSGSGSEDEDEDGQEEEEDDGASSSSSVFPISLESALTQPIYPSPHNPSEQLCVLCPDRLLKNQQMIKVHLDSKLHKRSLKRYSLRLTTNPPEEGADPREVVDEILAEMDSGEQADKEQISQMKEVKEKTDESKKRKRSNKKERKEAKAQQLISEQKQNSSSGKKQSGKMEEEEDEGGAKLNRKARRLLALQKGEIERKDRQK